MYVHVRVWTFYCTVKSGMLTACDPSFRFRETTEHTRILTPDAVGPRHLWLALIGWEDSSCGSKQDSCSSKQDAAADTIDPATVCILYNVYCTVCSIEFDSTKESEYQCHRCNKRLTNGKGMRRGIWNIVQ